VVPLAYFVEDPRRDCVAVPRQEKQGCGLATAPRGPIEQEQTDDYTLFGRLGS